MTQQFTLTSTGREHALNGLEVYELHNAPSITEIAHSLSQINRFTRHASRPYSVAEHSLLVANIAKRLGLPPIGQLAALMHDAHECITNDLASPTKEIIGNVWHEFESRHQETLLARYRLARAYRQYRAIIKQADLIALATERRDLMEYNPTINSPWPVIDTPGAEVEPDDVNKLNVRVRGLLDWKSWRSLFLDHFKLLSELAHLTTEELSVFDDNDSGAA